MATDYVKETEYYRWRAHDEWLKAGKTEKAFQVMTQPLEEPIFQPQSIHPEDVGMIDAVNESVKEIGYDLAGLDWDLSQMAVNYQQLLLETDKRAKKVKRFIESEKNRLEDHNLLCHRYRDFNDIEAIDLKTLSGDFSMYETYAALPETGRLLTDWTVTSASGNGYAGNAHVYTDNNEPLKNVMPTDNLLSLWHATSSAAFEYSRITATNEPFAFKDVNFDQSPVRLTLELSCDKSSNQLIIHGKKDTNVVRVMTSQDGREYRDLNLPLTSLKDNLFVGCLPAKYFRIFLESTVKTGEMIGFEKEPGKITYLKTARRSVISLTYIETAYALFGPSTVLESKELRTENTKAFAIYSEEFIPNHFKRGQYIRYEVTVNGNTYEMSPVNSQLPGISVLYTSDMSGQFPVNSAAIREKIESVRLRIFMKGQQQESPYLRNLKILRIMEVVNNV